MKTNTWNIMHEALGDLPFSTVADLAWQSELSVGTVRKYLAEMRRRGEVVTRDDLRESDVYNGRRRLYHVTLYALKEDFPERR